jgi:hypothetical protein
MATIERKQIYELKGQRKAKRRYVTMARRFERQQIVLERKYQENLAREILKHI